MARFWHWPKAATETHPVVTATSLHRKPKRAL
jgi:hypothetical protein